MKVVDLPTYKAEITIGMMEGYNGPLHTQREVLAFCQGYCDQVGLGVEVIFGTCVYTHGNEPCVRISLINYPRFPKDPQFVFEQAQELGIMIAAAFKQQRFTIVATDITRMIEMEG
jgi:hypothetical protein